MKYINDLLISGLLIISTTVLQADVFGDILIERGMNLKTKSYMGWARVLKNDERRKEYKLDDLSTDEVTFFIAQLKVEAKKYAFNGKLR